MGRVPARSVPPLATGDRLTRAEFERRAALLPEHVKVELLDGEILDRSLESKEHEVFAPALGRRLSASRRRRP
jgi:hypothetical protein